MKGAKWKTFSKKKWFANGFCKLVLNYNVDGKAVSNE